MATIRTTEKILAYLEKQDKAVTQTQIVADCGLHSYAVSEVLDLLHKFGKIEVWSNGKTSLIKLVEEQGVQAR